MREGHKGESPSHNGLCGLVLDERQEVEGAASLEIQDDGGVGPPLAERPLDDARARRAQRRQLPGHPQQGGGAGRRGQVHEQPCGGQPAQPEAGLGVRPGEVAGALGMAGEQLREPLGEGGAGTDQVAAVEAPDRQLQPDRHAAGRQIGSLSPISAMDRRAAGPARRAAGVIVPCSGEDGEGGGAVPRDADDGQGAEQSHAPICLPTTIRATSQPSCSPFHQTRR
jgi:hypothetical protein